MNVLDIVLPIFMNQHPFPIHGHSMVFSIKLTTSDNAIPETQVFCDRNSQLLIHLGIEATKKYLFHFCHVQIKLDLSFRNFKRILIGILCVQTFPGTRFFQNIYLYTKLLLLSIVPWFFWQISTSLPNTHESRKNTHLPNGFNRGIHPRYANKYSFKQYYCLKIKDLKLYTKLILKNVLNVTMSPKSHCCNSKLCWDRSKRGNLTTMYKLALYSIALLYLHPSPPLFPMPM